MKSFKLTLLVVVVILFNSNLSNAQNFKWKLVKSKNEIANRSECGMAAVNDKLYIIGGDANEALPVECFDTKTLKFTQLAKAPSILHHFQAVAWNNKIFVLDAFSSGGFPNQVPASEVNIYNTQNNTWEKGGKIAEERKRAGAGAVVYKGKLYLIAGILHGHSSGTNSMFDMYDPETEKWTALPDAPHIRDHCSAAIINDKLYVVGGRNTSFRDPEHKLTFFSQTVLEVDCYDFATGTWSILAAKLPLGSGGGAVVSYNNVLYYMGGERATATEPNAARKDVFRYNPLTDTAWIAIDSLHFGRNGMAATVCNNKIYVAGGAGGGGMPPPGKPGMPPDLNPSNMPVQDTSHIPPPPMPLPGLNHPNNKLSMEVLTTY